MSALASLLAAAVFTARVAAERLGLMYFASRAGARRQLLEQARALRGRR